MQIVDARIKVYVRFNRNIMGCKFMWVINRFFSCSDLIGT